MTTLEIEINKNQEITGTLNLVTALLKNSFLLQLLCDPNKPQQIYIIKKPY
jgi:hypothetical protein